MNIRRILIWSVDPRVPTAYGTQCGLLARELVKLGYQVSIGAIGQRLKDRDQSWKQIPVRFVGGRGTHGSDVLAAEAARVKADLVLLLLDSFMVDARVVGALECKVAYWCPVDAFNMADGGLPVLYSGMLQLAPRAVPIAMSRWAEAMFRHDGREPLYVPHMIDTRVFAPLTPEQRAWQRHRQHIPEGAFVITLCAANSERFRKNFPGQFDAFRRAARDNWLLLVHSYCRPDQDGWDLEWLADKSGIADKVRFADPDRYKEGAYTAADLAGWYNLGDLHTQCTLAEGFGIPLIEAQACSLPVVATDGSAMSELVAPGGWRVSGEPIMNPGQRAEWIVPHRKIIAQAYQAAERYSQTGPGWGNLRAAARQFAVQFSIETVMADHWGPALAVLEDR